MKKIKICLVSAAQTSFWGSEKNKYQNFYIPEMEKLAEKLGFELCYLESYITNKKEAVEAKKKIMELKPDFLLIQLSTFAAGEIILPLVDTGVRLGLWGIPEITTTGAIPNNSFCGVNMYAGIIHQYIGNKRKVKWFYGEVDDEMFVKRLAVTVRALSAIKNLAGATIGLLGGIAPGFTDLYFDERITFNKLGVRVNSLIEFDDVKGKALSYQPKDFAYIIDEIKSEYESIGDNLDLDHLETVARVYKAFEDITKENEFDAIAISCWPKFRKDMGIVVCSIIGRLLEKGIPAACEGDVDSVISMLMLKTISGGEMPMLMDLSKFDESDQTVLMWHCGSAPKRYASKGKVDLNGHYKPGSRVTGADDKYVMGVNELYFGDAPVTIARLTNDYKNMLSFTGDFVEKADKSFDGSRGWIGNVKHDGKDVPTKTLVNTLLSQCLQHHFPIVRGHFEEEVLELMAWLDIKPVEYLEYKNYLQTPTLL